MSQKYAKPYWGYLIQKKPWIEFEYLFPLPIYTFLFLLIVYINKLGADLIFKHQKQKKIILFFTICLSFIPLTYYKYSNFFLNTLSEILNSLNIYSIDESIQSLVVKTESLSIIMPIGISFITFQIVSYTIDVFLKKEKPHCFTDLALFAFYFPQLIAGPIMRASELIAQLNSPISINKESIRLGHYYFFRGLIKKVVIADFIALFIDPTYSTFSANSFTLNFATTCLYAFQIYYDFSGYSDMAKGISSYLGINLVKNFNFPYLAKNPGDFWSRWHISLSTWFRDYIYIPLGGNKLKKQKYAFAILLTMTTSALWHGAAYHFILWGVYHAILIIVYKRYHHIWNKMFVPIQIFIMFLLASFGWILFRIQHISHLFDLKNFLPFKSEITKLENIIILIFICYLVHIAEYFQESKPIKIKSSLARNALYFSALCLAFLFSTNVQKFIYFQF